MRRPTDPFRSCPFVHFFRRQKGSPMPLYEFEGKRPQIHESAFVADSASIVGEVVVEENASIWYGVVIRADYGPVIIRSGANVQDGSVIHGPPGQPMEVGPGATVGHLCVVHGAV